jgi:integration host factor subunit beta
MTKSELIERLEPKQPHLSVRDVELAVKMLVNRMGDALATGERIEIRGFGSFTLRFRPPRIGQNPRTGEKLAIDGRYITHFRPGKELRDRVNER